ncbi:hypothetical protein J2T60_001380 [Natronospira proteinivora]|uniref:Uncharacterized protein n=1 Tax=Natronospira proteinivora TaxID=1807133 RepID=A0ABT1G7Y9_9GAMM|nr:hypothetical protein [Natronospira proteinivora]MCP1727415.1 hypothetical protein [Natronospira proteinivora]
MVAASGGSIDVGEALAHNQAVMARREKTMGLSIQRETFMLGQLSEKLGGNNQSAVA